VGIDRDAGAFRRGNFLPALKHHMLDSRFLQEMGGNESSDAPAHNNDAKIITQLLGHIAGDLWLLSGTVRHVTSGITLPITKYPIARSRCRSLLADRRTEEPRAGGKLAASVLQSAQNHLVEGSVRDAGLTEHAGNHDVNSRWP
jgi:hypothetical protein